VLASVGYVDIDGELASFSGLKFVPGLIALLGPSMASDGFLTPSLFVQIKELMRWWRTLPSHGGLCQHRLFAFPA
jgi:hypothetical protein